MRGNSSYCRRLEKGKNSQMLWIKICKVGCKYHCIAPTIIFNLSLTRKSLLGVGTSYLRFMGYCSWNNKVVKALMASWFRRSNGQQSYMEHGAWGWDRKVLLMFLARNSYFFVHGKSPCEIKTHANCLFFYSLILINSEWHGLAFFKTSWMRREMGRESMEACYVFLFP